MLPLQLDFCVNLFDMSRKREGKEGVGEDATSGLSDYL